MSARTNSTAALTFAGPFPPLPPERRDRKLANVARLRYAGTCCYGSPVSTTGTTTIRLEDALKARIAAAAARAGKSAHAFMLDAIAQTVAESEADAALHTVAEARWTAIAAGGPAVAWEDTRTWLEARTAGATPPRPPAIGPARKTPPG
ncbi:MAG: ribbon-helix-helix protein, CopG family [Proteobacteria bacterium]|nr:ribbon-helix-helix protein, CopG family [Pseudomonadota bacterium]